MSLQRVYQQLKNVYHFFQAHFWRIVYGRPEKSLSIYGVTGTNGKTTTCYLLYSILAAAYGVDKVGMLTTVAFRIGKKEVINETKMTTLPSKLVYRYLRQMKQAGVEYVALEITSHALDQNRLAGIRLKGAVILNIEREHLDYHRTMAAYAKAKEKITNYLEESAPLVGKEDNEHVAAILRTSEQRGLHVISFSNEQAKRQETPLAGDFNKENVLAAKLLTRELEISRDRIKQGIDTVKYVPGRMEWIDAPQGFRILIDYAVTPDALEKLYAHVKEHTAKSGGSILAILGAAGLRDRGKRPDMARVVAAYADLLVLTREDPWTEDEEQIFSDLEKGLSEVPKEKWMRITDRRKALQFLLAQAYPPDIVVVTGKGAEQGMGVGKKIIPWNDKKVILEILKEMGKEKNGERKVKSDAKQNKSPK